MSETSTVTLANPVSSVTVEKSAYVIYRPVDMRSATSALLYSKTCSKMMPTYPRRKILIMTSFA